MTKRDALPGLLAAAFFFSCSENEPESPTILAEEPEVVAAPPIAPPAVAAVAPPLLAWSFEPASADCNGWPVLGAEAIRSTPARSGTYACKVCATGIAPDLHIERTLGAVPAGRYTLTAWVRRRGEVAAPAEATASLDADTRAGARVALAPVVSIGDDWDRLETTLELGEVATSLRLSVGAPVTGAERCLLLDDVSVVRED